MQIKVIKYSDQRKMVADPRDYIGTAYYTSSNSGAGRIYRVNVFLRDGKPDLNLQDCLTIFTRNGKSCVRLRSGIAINAATATAVIQALPKPRL